MRKSSSVEQMALELVTLVVDDQDEAIDFFVNVLGFELTTDEPSTTNDGRPKRWVVVQPPGPGTGLLLARADSDEHRAVVGAQFAGRVGLFLRVDDFDATFDRLVAAGAQIVGEPRNEPYGRVVVFVDIVGNRWDLLGPEPKADAGSVATPLLVRRERVDDEAAVRGVHAAAFAGMTDGEPEEVALLDQLRTCDQWRPELSIVAERSGEPIGHVVATTGFVGDVEGVGLGPIGVLPAHQGAGVGSALMRAIIGAADAIDIPFVALLGSPDYYRRFGFLASTELRIDPPDPTWGRHFQVLPLNAWDPATAGVFRYAPPFSELD